MATLRSKNTVPPRGFAFIVPESKLTITEESLDSLVLKVIQHRVHIGTTPTDYETVELEIQRQICSRLTESECRSEGISDEWVPIKDAVGIPSPKAILGFSKAAIEWVASGRDLVPQSEAQRRREICIKCSLNISVGGCKCSLFYKAVAKAIPPERRFPGLGVCIACSCSLTAKVNLPMNVIRESNKGRALDFPGYCWQNEAVQKV